MSGLYRGALAYTAQGAYMVHIQSVYLFHLCYVHRRQGPRLVVGAENSAAAAAACKKAPMNCSSYPYFANQSDAGTAMARIIHGVPTYPCI